MKPAYSVERLAFRKFLSAVRCPLSARTVRCFLFALVLLSAVRYPLSASYGLEVEPHRLELTISAEEPTHGSLEITNRADYPVRVRLKSGPYRFFQPGLKIPSAQTWLDLQPNDFTLAPRSAGQVIYEITPPPNVAQDTAGEYLAAILVDQLPEPSEGEGGPAGSSKITIIPRFAMPVYLQIQDRQRVEVRLTEADVQGNDPGLYDPESVQEKPARLLWLTLSLENTGTVHVRPSGTYVLFEESGEVLQGGPLGKALPLLPTATMKIPTAIPLPKPGRYRTIVTVDAGAEREADLLQREIFFEVTQADQVVQAGGTPGPPEVPDEAFNWGEMLQLR